MIYGVGCDIIETARVKKSCERQGFLTRVYSEREREAFAGDLSKLASNFAAKEAFSKALGTGVRGFSLDEVSVLRDELGKPYYAFSGKAARIVERLGVTAHLSLSDTAELKLAFAVLETGD